jgi:hypothetical protein
MGFFLLVVALCTISLAQTGPCDTSELVEEEKQLLALNDGTPLSCGQGAACAYSADGACHVTKLSGSGLSLICSTAPFQTCPPFLASLEKVSFPFLTSSLGQVELQGMNATTTVSFPVLTETAGFSLYLMPAISHLDLSSLHSSSADLQFSSGPEILALPRLETITAKLYVSYALKSLEVPILKSIYGLNASLYCFCVLWSYLFS